MLFRSGITAVTLTYPLDVIHSRLAFQIKGKEIYAGIFDSIKKIFNEKRSIFSFYRGYLVTVLGMIPYAGLSFSSFDRIKQILITNKVMYFTRESPANKKYSELTVTGKLLSGACTAAITQTIVYPMDVVRSHMQLLVMIKDASIKENFGMIDTIKYVYNKYGIVGGFYRGVSLNYIRAIPMVATSFCTYELSKKYLGLDTGIKVA